MQQLRLWELPRSNLYAKLLAERESGVEVFYHFNGRPIFHAPTEIPEA